MASSVMNRNSWAPIVVALFLVVAVGFYLSGGLGGGKPGTGITVGSKAEEISVVGLNGEPFVLSEHRGEVVVLEFMTTWCGVCKGQHDELASFHEEAEDVFVASIEVDQSLQEETFKSWATTVGFDWFVGHSPGAGRTYKVTGVPTVIVVDKEGIIRYRKHYTSSSDLMKIVRDYR
jgi:cytochrome c biogenesis protein CcmG/thiol:disulfide interchange protein DsbE